jgi:hypothetical protein
MQDYSLNKYQRGKIYKLVSDQILDIYIGSTTKKLFRRLSNHMSDYNNNRHYTTAFELLQYDDVRIELIENYPYTSKDLLELREGIVVKELDCINKVIPGQTAEEYYIKNKDKILKQRRQYYDENVEKVNAQKKKYREENVEKIKQINKKYSDANI